MAQENSFDVVSRVDMMEVRNAVDQAMREIRTRFDFKESASSIALEGEKLVLVSDNEGKLRSVTDVLQGKLVKRGVSLRALDYGKVEPAAKGTVRQEVAIRQGIGAEKAKEIVRLIKTRKLRVQAAIQEDQVRVSSKSKDELQEVIQMLRATDVGVDLQFTNRR